jgi:hypothetical protein
MVAAKKSLCVGGANRTLPVAPPRFVPSRDRKGVVARK